MAMCCLCVCMCVLFLCDLLVQALTFTHIYDHRFGAILVFIGKCFIKCMSKPIYVHVAMTNQLYLYSDKTGFRQGLYAFLCSAEHNGRSFEESL